MTADVIATVVADLRAERIRHVVDDSRLNTLASARVKTATVVDATTIYASLVAKDEPVWIYEDHPNIAPPWESAAICYVNEHGNVILMQVTATEHDRSSAWNSENEIRWHDVRWVMEVFLWIGGRSAEKGPFPTTGPIHMWRIAVYGNGEPANIRWYHLCPEYPMENWDMAHLVLLGSLNFMSCRNVQLVEPQRQRAQRRRLERLGVSVKTISVFPMGRSYGGRLAGNGQGLPLTSVRGHFACYGPEYGRGLLFGKLSGRFWIPQHARGSAEHGSSVPDYRLRADVSRGTGDAAVNS